MVENATFQWEIVLARHMVLSWPLSFLFNLGTPATTNYACKRSWKVFQKIMCVKHYLKKVGRMQVKIYSTELQLYFSFGLEEKHSCKTTGIKSTHHFGSRLSGIVFFNSETF